jgi:hypothetical protein
MESRFAVASDPRLTRAPYLVDNGDTDSGFTAERVFRTVR